MSSRLSWPTAAWLAVKGGRADTTRIVLTASGSAVGTIALLSAATVISIGPDDGPYSRAVLAQEGLHQGVVAAFVLLCIPVLAFVGQCSRVGAPARDRRLAAIRMAGGTGRDVIRVACGEAGLSAGVGAVAGLVIYAFGRSVLGAADPGPVLDLPTDVLPPIVVMALLLVTVPIGAVAFTRLALRGVTVSPFGVIRHRRINPPRLAPALAFLAGVVALAFLATITSGETVNCTFGSCASGAVAANPDSWTLPVALVLILLTAGGLVLGNAAVAAAIGGFLAPRARRPAVLIAARRLCADPFAASRAFGALLLTVFIGAGAQGVRAFVLTGTESSDRFYADTHDLVDLVIIVAVVVASLGLLVVAAEGILTRRRSLAALTAAGTPVGVLRRALLVELLLPLVPMSVLAAAAGILAQRGLFGTTVSHASQRSTEVLAVPVPWAELGVLVGGTLLVTLLISSVSLLFLRGSLDLVELRAAA